MRRFKANNLQRSPKKKLLIIAGNIVVLVAIGIVLEKTGVTDFYSSGKQPVESGTKEPTINFGPPTSDEQQAGDKQKDDNLQSEEKRTNTDDTSIHTASVIITDAGQYDDVIEVRAFVPDYYQDGTCIIKFTKDSLKVTKSTPAYRDVSTTICTNPLLSRSEFASPGNWQLVVEFESAGVKAKSEVKQVTIQ